MLQRLTNYNNIRKINCRPVSHEIPPASLMAQPNAPACPLIKKPPSHATSTPLSRRARFDLESEFNSSSTSISDISTTESSESEQSTVISMSPPRKEGILKLAGCKDQISHNNRNSNCVIPCRSESRPITQKNTGIIKKQDLSASKVTDTTKFKKLRFNIPPEGDLPIPSKCPSPETDSREGVSCPEDLTDVTLCCPVSLGTQLLHPDWRKVPWRDFFGWTEAHEALMKKLKTERTNGESIYYRDEEEYEASRKCWADVQDPEEFLGGPSVTSVVDMLEVMKQKRDRGSFSYIPKRSPRRRCGYNVSYYESESE